MSPKKCVFGCEGKITLFSFPKKPALREQWMRRVFPGQSRSCASAFVCSRHFSDQSFVNKAQFDAGFADRLKLREGAVPAGTEPRSEPSSSAGIQRRSAPSQKNAATQTGALCAEMWRRVANTSGLTAKRPRMEEERLQHTHLPSGRSDPTEPKYVVFESRLRELFHTCPVCVCECSVQRRRRGAFVAFQQVCARCGYTRAWQSQPLRGSTPLGNLQMSAAAYFTGGSFAQMQEMCRAMNLQIHGSDSFRRHVRVFLEPSVQHKWKTDQQAMLQTLRAQGKLTLSGDMHTHSTGRSAGYGSYTLVHVGSSRVLDVQLLQSSGVGGRAHLEREGLRRALDVLESGQVQVERVLTDRHTRVHEELSRRRVQHCYSVPHLLRELWRKLQKLCRSRGCWELRRWRRSIANHMLWSAESSQDGPEGVAKWKSLVNHIQDVHTHDDPLFPRCAHPHAAPSRHRKWLKPGSRVLYKLEKLLLNQRLLRDVGKLSHQHQTPALQTFHRVSQRFILDRRDFPFIGRLCRLYLAAMHFNESADALLTREDVLCAEPERRLNTEPSFGCVCELMRLLGETALAAEELPVAQTTGAGSATAS